MTVTVAKSAGFCFGVRRAVNIVEKLLDEGKKVYTLGPIIHNGNMVEELASKGVRIADSPDDVKNGETLVIRSHGVPKNITDRIDELKIDFMNTQEMHNDSILS